MKIVKASLIALLVNASAAELRGLTNKKASARAVNCVGNVCDLKMAVDNLHATTSLHLKLPGEHGDRIFIQKNVNPRERTLSTIVGQDNDHHYFYGEDETGSTISLLRESNGDVFATIHDNGIAHQIAPNHLGKARITYNSIESFPLNTEGYTTDFVDDSATEDDDVEDDGQEWTRRALFEKEINFPSGMPDEAPPEQRHLNFNDNDHVIDIMMPWTILAECAISGLKAGCTITEQTTRNVRGLLKKGIEEVNQAFEGSEMSTRLRLVHSYMYDVQEPFPKPALTVIARHGDGIMDDVYDIREEYGADMISLVAVHMNSCGSARGRPTPGRNDIFTVVHWSCTGVMSLGHEIGHAMGCKHDRGRTNSCEDDSDYSYGYRDPEGEFRTIMAYHCVTGECDNNPGGRCNGIMRFSNPDTTWNGKPIGDERNNCARRISENTVRVAGFEPAKCFSDQECDDGKDNTDDTCINKTCRNIERTPAPTEPHVSPPIPTPAPGQTQIFTDKLAYAPGEEIQLSWENMEEGHWDHMSIDYLESDDSDPKQLYYRFHCGHYGLTCGGSEQNVPFNFETAFGSWIEWHPFDQTILQPSTYTFFVARLRDDDWKVIMSSKVFTIGKVPTGATGTFVKTCDSSDFTTLTIGGLGAKSCGEVKRQQMDLCSEKDTSGTFVWETCQEQCRHISMCY